MKFTRQILFSVLDLISESQKIELVVMPLLNGGDIENGNANKR